MAKKAPKAAAKPPPEPEEAFLGNTQSTALHAFRMPTITAPNSGAQVLDQRSVSVLTALENFLAYARIPRKKAVAAGQLLVLALELNSQRIWSRVISILAAHTAEGGYRAEQAVSVLVADKGRQTAALLRLDQMGPKPPEPTQDGK